MGKRSIVPFGPQHPVLPEPIHLDLVLEDEKVVEAVPSIGFVHRGLEKLVEKKDFQQYVYVAERICGICSFMHGMGYCAAVENIMNIEIPPRAKSVSYTHLPSSGQELFPDTGDLSGICPFPVFDCVSSGTSPVSKIHTAGTGTPCPLLSFFKKD